MGPAEEAAKIALFVLQAVTATEPGGLRGYRIAPDTSVVDFEQASRLMAKELGPLACSARLEDQVLVVQCGQITDPGQQAVHSQRSAYHISGWREDFRASEGQDSSLELQAAGLSVKTTLTAWYDFLTTYEVEFVAGRPIGARTERPRNVLIISPTGEIRVNFGNPP